jgi:hypothetical protein
MSIIYAHINNDRIVTLAQFPPSSPLPVLALGPLGSKELQQNLTGIPALKSDRLV